MSLGLRRGLLWVTALIGAYVGTWAAFGPRSPSAAPPCSEGCSCSVRSPVLPRHGTPMDERFRQTVES